MPRLNQPFLVQPRQNAQGERVLRILLRSLILVYGSNPVEGFIQGWVWVRIISLKPSIEQPSWKRAVEFTAQEVNK